mgnify:CR=1 FL=1
MFYGSFIHSLDDKGRVVIPAKMREQTGTKLFIMKGFDGALSIFQEESFNKMMEEFSKLPFNHKASRDYMRTQLASVCELEIDRIGRVQIPSAMLAKYHIGKEVVILGALDHIEIWDKKAFEQYDNQTESDFEKTAEELGLN